MAEPRRELDWRAAYARIERGSRVLSGARDRTQAETERILRERASRFAMPEEMPAEPADSFSAVVFTLGRERYAVDASCVTEVIPFRSPTPVPCTPAFVLGVVNHRGRVLAVLDLRVVFQLAADPAEAGGHFLVVAPRSMTFAIHAQTVIGARLIARGELTPTPPGERAAFITGVTPALTGILDLEALARSSRLLVNEPASDNALAPRLTIGTART
jgi:purine-binding chemotaxis protein CheW